MNKKRDLITENHHNNVQNERSLSNGWIIPKKYLQNL